MSQATEQSWWLRYKKDKTTPKIHKKWTDEKLSEKIDKKVKMNKRQTYGQKINTK